MRYFFFFVISGILLSLSGCQSPLYQKLEAPRPLTSQAYPQLNTVPDRIPPYPPEKIQALRRTLEQNAADLHQHVEETMTQEQDTQQRQ